MVQFCIIIFCSLLSGCYHTYLKRYGFRATMWDQLGVCLIDGLVVQVEVSASLAKNQK